jgi:hypothetical protein
MQLIYIVNFWPMGLLAAVVVMCWSDGRTCDGALVYLRVVIQLWHLPRQAAPAEHHNSM